MGRKFAPALIVLAALSVAPGATGWRPAPAAAESLAGKLLVATPEMSDPRFAETVIVITEHGPKGALGFVVNRVGGQRPIAEILRALGRDPGGVTGSIDIHWGGPVGVDGAVVLHSQDYALPSTKRTGGGYAVTADPQILVDIGNGKGPKEYFFVRGYAGWGPGQLERELKGNSWIVIPDDKRLVFRHSHDDTWRRALDRKGIDL